MAVNIYGRHNPGAGCWECPHCPYRIHDDHPNGWEDAVVEHELAHELSPTPKAKRTPSPRDVIERELAKHRPIATAISRSWGPIPGLETDDIEQEGLIALLEAHVNFDPGRGVTFRRFADTVIRLRLHDLETKARRQKHAPLNTAIVAVKGKNGQDVFLVEFVGDRAPTPHRVAIGRETLHELAFAIEFTLTESERLAIRGVLNDTPYSVLAVGFEAGERGVDNAVQRARRKLRLVTEGMG